MKKILIFLMAVTLCSQGFAQREHGGRDGRAGRMGGRSGQIVDARKHAFYLGFKAGFDLTTMSEPNKSNKVYDGAGLGFTGAFAGRVRFDKATRSAKAGTGLLGAGLELKYKSNVVKTTGTDEKGKDNANLSIGYFEVPVFVQLYPFYQTDGMSDFYIELGPDFAGTLSRSPKTLTVGGNAGNTTYYLDSDGSKLKGMDVRVMAGIGYDFAIKNDKQETTSLIGINARYYLGTSKLAGNFDSKMNSFEIAVSFMFNAGKF